MATALQTIDNSPKALGSSVCDNPKLAKLVDEFQPGIAQRLPTPSERVELAALIPAYEAGLIPAPRGEIRRMVTRLALAFPQATKSTADEIEARLELYAMALGDVPADILGNACLEAMRTHTFFPAPAEILKLCKGFALRQWRLSRIRHLIDRHDNEWKPEPAPEPPLNADDQAKVDGWLKQHGIAA